MKILFIGAGNMACAIINGIIKKRTIKSNDISIYEIDEVKARKISEEYQINICNKLDTKISIFDVIILAVKPQVFLNFSNDLNIKNLPAFINKNQLLVSIMAGININKIKSFFGESIEVIRIMPNTPALIGKSMSVICKSENVKIKTFEEVNNIFASIGETEILEEKYFDAVTALSGSGPAYVFAFIEAITQGGILCGLPKNIAEKLAIQTVIGSSMMIDKNNSVEELRHKVTSPGGTTIEGMSILEKYCFRSSLIEAIRAAYNKSKELSEKK